MGQEHFSPGIVCVFCGGARDVDPRYYDVAQQAGRWIGERGYGLVYGGGRVGLMGAVADAALGAGGHVTGVIPRHLQEREIAHGGLASLEITETMHERQMRMVQLSDVFMVLPGGLGTLAEFFEVVTWRQLGLHDKPIVVVNSFQYWDSLISMIESIQAENFLHVSGRPLFRVVPSVAGLGEAIAQGA